MKRKPAANVVLRSASLFLVAALVTAGAPMSVTALRNGTATATAGATPAQMRVVAVVRQPRLIAPVAPALLAEAPHDPSVARQEAASLRNVARDAGIAAAALAAKLRAEAEARAKAEAERKAAEAKARAEAKAKAAAAAKAKAAAAAKAKAAAAAKTQAAKAKPSTSTKATNTGYRGRNHFWYPALGISAGVQWFPCDRSRPPDAGLYRWGCAGVNNVYLMAHAWSTFRALNRAYYNGGLQAGQLAVYADNNGRVHYFRLAWLKTGPPTTAMSWAWAPQSRSSMTLQTCIGANSEYRLFVRFHEVSGP